MRVRNKRRKLGLSIAALAFASLALCVTLSAQKIAVTPVEQRPYVLVVYADWCPSCQHLKPALAFINDKYRGRIRFVRYDITSDETVAASKEMVAKIGLAKFFEENHEQTSLVVILDPSRHEVFRAVNDYTPEHYEAALDQQLQNAASH